MAETKKGGDGNGKDYIENIGNGNSIEIQLGHTFTKDEGSWSGLNEGCGVVAYFEGENLRAYTQTWNCEHPYWEEYLTKALVFAKQYFQYKAMIFRRKDGKLVCDDVAGVEFLRGIKKVSAIPSVKPTHPPQPTTFCT